MKKLTTLLLFVFVINLSSVFPQHIPFQGKLYQNGNPVSGLQNFTFSMPGISWSETWNSVLVDSGLYSVVLGNNTAFSTNPFLGVPSQLLYVQVNGNPLDTILLYPPIESQTLNYSSGTLSISSGNSVNLGSNDSLYANYLQIGDTSTSNNLCADQSNNFSFHQGPVNDIWQAFTPTCTGRLTKIEVNFANNNSTTILIKIFEGVGVLGAPQGTTMSFAPGTTFQNWQVFDIKTLYPNNIINLIAGHDYTFEVYTSPSINTFDLYMSNSNSYIWNVSSFGSSSDLAFKIHMDQPSTATLMNSNGNVGIGTSNPTSALTVGGRIEDKTGFVMPVGSIVPYAGTTTPKGWLFCDGSPIRRDLYQDLYGAIGENWGNGDGLTTFNLPDLRGYFMRGRDSTAGRDPQASTRHAQGAGANSGNTVGSIEDDAIQDHTHSSNNSYTIAGVCGNTGWGDHHFARGTNGCYEQGESGEMTVNVTGMNGGNMSSETRPKNVYVNYIIKY